MTGTWRRCQELEASPCFTAELPGDPSEENATREVRGALYSYVTPTPPESEGPTLVAASATTAGVLELDTAEFGSPHFASVMGGATRLTSGGRVVRSFAQCYGGHQFGNWASQLGDGRAISIAEVLNSRGERWELQLKGAGQTPFSRRGDGRAVMRSSIREFVASEAFVALGIPTTRALSIVATNAPVLRDMFYDGRPKLEPGAVVCRVARSFIRFGTFELPASRQDVGLVKQLLDFVVKHYYPEHSTPVALLTEVTRRTAKLAAQWQAVGFVHGVLNTDNCSILGDTIDFGPYGWMEVFDSAFTPNTTDLPGRRYCYGNQPQVMLWNCAMLANALLRAGLMTKEEAQATVNSYGPVLEAEYQRLFAAKLGLRGSSDKLVEELLSLMEKDSCDFTRTFRWLSRIPGTAAPPDASTDSLLAPLADVLPSKLDAGRRDAWAGWVRTYRAALDTEGVSDAERSASQDKVNPLYVPRNYLLQEVIEAAEKGDYAPLHDLLAVLKQPFDVHPGKEKWAAQAPEWALVTPGVCVLSCSS